MTLRKTFFWLHLVAGAVAGLVILIMSVTGVILMYERQMVEWADRGFRALPPAAGGQRLPVESLLAKVREQRGVLPSTLTLKSDPAAPAALAFGRDGILYVDPYTGAVLGEGSKQVRQFFHVVTDWHRWLGVEGAGRSTARAITGACNLAFLFLALSGFYLWWPRKWRWQSVKAVTLFRGGLSGKARDFNWHNVIGFWTAAPLAIVVLTGVVMSYPWANALLYRMTGTEPPAMGQGPGGGGPPRGEGQREGRARRPEGGDRREGRPRGEARADGGERRREGGGGERSGAASAGGGGPRGGFGPPSVDLNLEGLDRLWSRAEQQVQGWRSISLPLPMSGRAPLVFTIDRGGGGRPDLRGQLTLQRETGEVVRWEPFSSYNLGRKLRMWVRFGHTGEAAGFLGQTIAGIASAGGVMLVWTGISLALRRFAAWRTRRRSRQRRSIGLNRPAPSGVYPCDPRMRY